MRSQIDAVAKGDLTLARLDSVSRLRPSSRSQHISVRIPALNCWLLTKDATKKIETKNDSREWSVWAGTRKQTDRQTDKTRESHVSSDE
jgi:hypothetical protein